MPNHDAMKAAVPALILMAAIAFILPSSSHVIAGAGIPTPPAKPGELRVAPGAPVPGMKPAALNAPTPTPPAKPHISQDVALDIRDIPLPDKKPVFAQFYSGMHPDDDAKLYKEIFALQKEGKMKAADAKIRQLQGDALMGHVLYQRYMHPTAYRSTYAELHNWMEKYADLPRAKNIYALALKRRPTTERRSLREPVGVKFIAPMREPTMIPARSYHRDRTLSAEQKHRLDGLKTKVREAASLYYNGHYEDAYDRSRPVAREASYYIPQASWIYGLSNWRKKRFRTAAQAFETVAQSPYASGWEASAGAYWAARSYMRTGRSKDVKQWLEEAAKHPRTFYGLIATRALGKPFDFNWITPAYSKEHYKQIASTAAGERAIALVNAGQVGLAELELKRVDARRSPKLQQAMLAYAEHAGMPAISMRLGAIVRGEGGVYYDDALYPDGPWRIYGQGQVNKELVHALIRQESRFDPIAKSHSGAAGLMQIMPTTAAYVTGQPIYRTDAGRVFLEVPEKNLKIGSNYLKRIANMRNVKGNLFELLVAYNAGPGNLAKWKRADSNHGDQLLFVESIPSAETRVYVERVVANYWIYRMKKGKDTVTLDAIALGEEPKVEPTRRDRMRYAHNN